MPNESRELLLLREVLGNELGRMVWGLNLMASSVVQLGTQVQQMQAHAQAGQQGVPNGNGAAPTDDSVNHWVQAHTPERVS